MSDVIVREGYLQGNRSRKCDADKNPTGEWSNWYFSAANGSGYFSYLYSKRFVKDGTRYSPIYDDSGRPDRPDFGPAPRWNDRQAYSDFREKQAKWTNDVYSPWWNNRPIIGYYEYETRNIPGKMIMDSEDVK